MRASTWRTAIFLLFACGPPEREVQADPSGLPVLTDLDPDPGTRCLLLKGCADMPAETRVEVIEGVVSVHHAGGVVELRAGDTWSSGSAPAPAGTTTPSASAPAPSVPAASARPAESDLARQNALYESAMAAKRRGDDAAVISVLDTLLARWPDSPLAEEARRERARAAARREP